MFQAHSTSNQDGKDCGELNLKICALAHLQKEPTEHAEKHKAITKRAAPHILKREGIIIQYPRK